MVGFCVRGLLILFCSSSSPRVVFSIFHFCLCQCSYKQGLLFARGVGGSCLLCVVFHVVDCLDALLIDIFCASCIDIIILSGFCNNKPLAWR